MDLAPGRPAEAGAPDHHEEGDHDAQGPSARFVYEGSGSISELAMSAMAESDMGFGALGPDGTILFMTEAMGKLIGRSPRECVGRNMIEWLQPEDFDRAAGLMSLSAKQAPPPGTSRFIVAHADGSWIPLEISGTSAWDGSRNLTVIYCRNGEPRLALEEVIKLLLHGIDLPEIFAKVCDVIEWHGYGTHVAIAWHDDGIFHHVGTGLPGVIAGSDDDSASGCEGGVTPWACARQTRTEVNTTIDSLDEHRRLLATELGVRELWVVPVLFNPDRDPATITIWTIGLGRRPQVHSVGMSVARDMVELVLRWTDQQRALARMASKGALA